MIDPILGGIIVGGAIRQYRISNKYKKAGEISSRAVERVAEAEVRLEQYEKKTEIILNNLCTRMDGITDELQGSFYDMYKPFETSDNQLRETLVEDLCGIETIHSLSTIKQIQQQPSIQQLPAYKKLSGSAAAITFVLFGRMTDANRQLDNAATQSEKSRLIATHIDSICTSIDIQCEGYMRVYQVLGALNAALIVSMNKYQEYFQGIAWLLDSDGRFPSNIRTEQIEEALTPAGVNQLKNCINIARCIYAIMEKPIFDENRELTKAAEDLIVEGEKALRKIQAVERKGR